MLVEELGQYLQQRGHGTLGTNLWLYQLPDTPDICVAVRSYEGMDPLASQNDAYPGIERPRLQIAVRSTDISAAMTAAWAIWRDLARITNEIVNGAFYVSVRPLQSPFIIERDGMNRWVIAANFEAWKEI